MLQICDKAICKPLYFDIFFLYRARVFPTKWKMAYVVPIYKQGGKHVNNY